VRTGSVFIRKFFQWYVPRFNALSFPLACANEYEADAAAVRLTSPRAAAGALMYIVARSCPPVADWPVMWRRTGRDESSDGYRSRADDHVS
jgi:hypothetical protein